MILFLLFLFVFLMWWKAYGLITHRYPFTHRCAPNFCCSLRTFAEHPPNNANRSRPRKNPGKLSVLFLASASLYVKLDFQTTKIMLRLQVRYLWKSWLPLTRKRRTEFFLTSAKWGGADQWSSFSWVPLTPFARFQKEPAAINFSRLLVNEHRSHARAPHRVIFRSVWKSVDSPFDEYLSRRLLVFTKKNIYFILVVFCKCAPLSRESAAPSFFRGVFVKAIWNHPSLLHFWYKKSAPSFFRVKDILKVCNSSKDLSSNWYWKDGPGQGVTNGPGLAL